MKVTLRKKTVLYTEEYFIDLSVKPIGFIDYSVVKYHLFKIFKKIFQKKRDVRYLTGLQSGWVSPSQPRPSPVHYSHLNYLLVPGDIL